MRIEKKQF